MLLGPGSKTSGKIRDAAHSQYYGLENYPGEPTSYLAATSIALQLLDPARRASVIYTAEVAHIERQSATLAGYLYNAAGYGSYPDLHHQSNFSESVLPHIRPLSTLKDLTTLVNVQRRWVSQSSSSGLRPRSTPTTRRRSPFPSSTPSTSMVGCSSSHTLGSLLHFGHGMRFRRW
jgi:hypothetical protein